MHSLTAAAVLVASTTKRPGVTPRATTFAIVGNGWRSSVFIRMAYLMPERFELVGVVTLGGPRPAPPSNATGA